MNYKSSIVINLMPFLIIFNYVQCRVVRDKKKLLLGIEFEKDEGIIWINYPTDTK